MRTDSYESDEELVSLINTTPLVDVMLVLLIIFLITIPVVVQSVPVDLPKEANRPSQARPETITLAITRTGKLFWNNQPIADDDQLLGRLREAGALRPQPEVQLRGDRAARYEAIGKLLSACRRAGIGKVVFVTEPPARGE
jgi:biopolymer transport protein ExbD